MKRIRLSVAIMAHPDRKKQVDHVQSAIGRVPVVWDEKQDRWDTGRRSMLAFDPGCTHHLVIQDDTLPCRDLIPGLEHALMYCPPDVPVCLYIGRRRPEYNSVSSVCAVAERIGASWVTMHTLNWGPGVVVPTDAIKEMIQFCDPLREIKNYDRRLSRYWELSVHSRVWYTWPSLVDHADGPSLVRGRLGTDRRKGHTSRVAWRYAGERTSALDLCWTNPVADMPDPHGAGTRPDSVPYSGVKPQHVRDTMEVVRFKNKISGRTIELPKGSARVRHYRGMRNWEQVIEAV